MQERSWNEIYKAENALTDAECDIRNATFINYWHGRGRRPGFVIDLGCPVLIKKVLIRNAHNAGTFNA